MRQPAFIDQSLFAGLAEKAAANRAGGSITTSMRWKSLATAWRWGCSRIPIFRRTAT